MSINCRLLLSTAAAAAVVVIVVVGSMSVSFLPCRSEILCSLLSLFSILSLTSPPVFWEEIRHRIEKSIIDRGGLTGREGGKPAPGASMQVANLDSIPFPAFDAENGKENGRGRDAWWFLMRADLSLWMSVSRNLSYGTIVTCHTVILSSLTTPTTITTSTTAAATSTTVTPTPNKVSATRGRGGDDNDDDNNITNNPQ